MALALADKWVWDFWVAEDAGMFHLFYLQAPRDLEDPDRRHWHASIGHAVSRDLLDWTVRPDALTASAGPSWDDLATWTGSVIRHNDRWHLFYTGVSRAEGGLVQRVGLAVSDDLDTWERVPGPLIECDPRWYDRLGSGWHDEAWRDPWVFRAEDGSFHALITARTRSGRRFDRGCIAHARSGDLLQWEVLPPITSPGGFGQLEVPQMHRVGDDWCLVFCSDVETQSSDRRSAGVGTGTFYAMGASPFGPFDVASAKPLQADPRGSGYAGRLIEHGGTQLMSWRRTGGDGRFIGEIADPVRVTRSASALSAQWVAQ
jgi:beta-fructofuranosidase